MRVDCALICPRHRTRARQCTRATCTCARLQIFRTIEEAKSSGRLRLDDYAVSQCTLEQVFISIAKEQDEETGRIQGMSYAGEDADADAL